MSSDGLTKLSSWSGGFETWSHSLVSAVSSGVVVSGRCKGTLCIKCFNLSGKTIWKNAVPDLDRIYALCHVKDGPREWLIVSKLNKLEVRHAESGIVKQTIDTKFTTISLSSMSTDSRSFLSFRDDGKISHFIIHESILTDKRQTLSTHLNLKSGCWMELACDPIVVITLSAPSEGVVRALNYPTGTTAWELQSHFMEKPITPSGICGNKWFDLYIADGMNKRILQVNANKGIKIADILELPGMIHGVSWAVDDKYLVVMHGEHVGERMTISVFKDMSEMSSTC